MSSDGRRDDDGGDEPGARRALRPRVGRDRRDGGREPAIGATTFEGLRLLRQREMLAHRGARALSVVSAHRVVDVAVHLGRLLEVRP